MTSAFEVLLLVAAIKTLDHPILTVIYAVSAIVMGILLFRAKKTGAYSLLAKVGFAVFLFDTAVALLRS